MSSKLNLFLIVSLPFLAMAFCNDNTYGIITALKDKERSTNGLSSCIMYNAKFHSLPKTLNEALSLKIADVSTYNLCEDPGTNITTLVAGHVAAVSMQANCTYSVLAENVQTYGANATLVLQTEKQDSYNWVNSSEDYNKVNITVAVMRKTDFEAIVKLGGDIKVQMYSPLIASWDYNMILIWLMAVGTIVIGAYWSGLVTQHTRQTRDNNVHEHVTSHALRQAKDYLDISPLAIVILVIMMCAMLVLMYFFYDYIVYMVIGVFTLGTSVSLYGCLLPLYQRLPCLGDCRIPPNKLPILRFRPQIKCIILGALCMGVCITWVVFRNAKYAWIVQNTLGITFCIQIMKTYRLTSLKTCTILLALLFVYDIFFVFITPLFMPEGDSIMVRVATGGDSGEMLPMVLKAPYFEFSALTVCSSLKYSLLGYGDVMVPGLLISYCHGFDLKMASLEAPKPRLKIYYIASLIAYGLGLGMASVAVVLMQMGQPALLYLVPCTLLTTYAIALCKKEFKHMWNGALVKKGEASQKQSHCTENNTEPTRDGASATSDPIQSESARASDTSDEERALIVKQP